MKKATFKTIEEYFNTNKAFLVPDYQRGYKWAVQNPKKENKSSVQELMERLTYSFKDDPSTPYFLQGISVSESESEIILIDGQQRTTTLFLLLWCLNPINIKDIKLIYDVRDESREFISGLKWKTFSELIMEESDIQDIFYFKKAIQQIKNKIEEEILDKESFRDFILKKVTIIYIVIDDSKATRTFTMMNGQKATMKEEEKIKAEMLRMISLPDKIESKTNTSLDENLHNLKEIIAKDWEINNLRSKYAREWDKWLYWWNKDDVKDFFGVYTSMGHLISYYFEINKTVSNKMFSFENFKIFFLKDKKVTKDTFVGLRKLQKTFEDLYNNNLSYNYLGLSLISQNSSYTKFETIRYFIENKGNADKLKEYAKWYLVGATHRQITKSVELKDHEVTKEKCFLEVLGNLSSRVVYGVHNDIALKQLLRRNVIMDIELKRRFDFSIFNNKSLEHIHPKSKVYQIENGIKKRCDTNEECNADDYYILITDFKDDISEHCIGNLVLLSGPDNSSFNDKPFKLKKEIFFSPDPKKVKDSMTLLHSLTVFSKEKWDQTEIEKNKIEFLKEMNIFYGI